MDIIIIWINKKVRGYKIPIIKIMNANWGWTLIKRRKKKLRRRGEEKKFRVSNQIAIIPFDGFSVDFDQIEYLIAASFICRKIGTS